MLLSAHLVSSCCHPRYDCSTGKPHMSLPPRLHSTLSLVVVNHSNGSNGHIRIYSQTPGELQPWNWDRLGCRDMLIYLYYHLWEFLLMLSGAQYACVAHTKVHHTSFPLLLLPVLVSQVSTTSAEAGVLLLCCPTTLCPEVLSAAWKNDLKGNDTSIERITSGHLL